MDKKTVGSGGGPLCPAVGARIVAQEQPLCEAFWLARCGAKAKDRFKFKHACLEHKIRQCELKRITEYKRIVCLRVRNYITQICR
jgi:hypothetical protein